MVTPSPYLIAQVPQFCSTLNHCLSFCRLGKSFLLVGVGACSQFKFVVKTPVKKVTVRFRGAIVETTDYATTFSSRAELNQRLPYKYYNWGEEQRDSHAVAVRYLLSLLCTSLCFGSYPGFFDRFPSDGSHPELLDPGKRKPHPLTLFTLDRSLRRVTKIYEVSMPELSTRLSTTTSSSNVGNK